MKHLIAAMKPLKPTILIMGVIGAGLVAILLTPLVMAQSVTTSITPTIGIDNLGTTVTPPISGGTVYSITNGRAIGSNLFHSFGEFSVGSLDTAQFQTTTLGPNLSVDNILGRVTGGNPTTIFGTIDSISFYPNANLFLMNPAGIVFGPNAMLNVGGAVNITTADYLGLTDGIRFEAVPGAQDALLSTASVDAYGFLGSNPAAIAVQGGQLTLADGTGLSLIGGTRGFTYIDPDTGNPTSVPDGVTVNGGRLSAPNGEINLAITASPGEFLVTGLQPAANINGESFTSYGSVHLAAGSTIDVSGTDNVSIRSGQFVLSMSNALLTTAETPGGPNSITLSRGSSIITSNTALEAGADVEITTGALQMDGSSIKSVTTGEGQGGDISFTTQTVDLINGAQIVTSAAGAGSGGLITIAATDSITITGYDTQGTLQGVTTFFTDPNTEIPLVTSGMFSSTSASGNGGHISMSAPTLVLDNAGQIATLTSGAGHGGDIILNNISSLTLENGAQLFSSSGLDWVNNISSGTGAGGNISVTASDQVRVSGGNLDLFALTQISSQSSGIGGNGDITLRASSISFEEGGTLVSSKSVSSSDSPGLHGNISLISDSLTVSGAFDFEGELIPSGIQTIAIGPLSQTLGINAPLTDVNISVSSAYVSVDQGFIRSTHLRLATGGNLVFDVGDLSVTGGGSISAQGDGTLPTGRVLVTASGLVEVSGVVDGTRSVIENVAGGTGHGGDIAISAHQVLVSDSGRINSETRGLDGLNISISAEESVIVSNGGKIRIGVGDFDGGALNISAPSILLDQGILQTSTAGIGNAGSVVLTADHVMLTGGQIRSETEQTTGTGGNITIQASETISISGQFTGSDADTPGPAGIFARSFNSGGNAGNASLEAPIITVAGGGQINSSTSSAGLGGNIDILATSSLSLSGNWSGLFSETTASGQGGTIHAKVNHLEMADGAIISAQSFGSGNAGSVSIEGTASPALSVLIDGPGSGIFTDTQGAGAGGEITIQAKTLTIQNGGTISAATSGLGEAAIGGDVTVNASQAVNLRNNASISARSTGAADAGNITINAGNRLEARDSSVTTKSEQAGGGNIEINALDHIWLVNSQVNASAFLDGGNISIDPRLVLLQNSQILAQSIHGNGGNITITTPLFLSDQSSLVSASSQFGLNGTVTIQSPTSNLSGSLGTLTSKPSQAQSLLTQRCAALANGQASSFVVVGREQLPSDPGSWMTSPLALAALGESLDAVDVVASASPVITIAAHDTDAVSLRRLTPARFLMANFADSEATGCHS